MLGLLLTLLLGTVPVLTDWEKDRAEALSHAKPIVLLVSRTDCTFCKRFEQDVLAPLVKSEKFADTVIYRELVMDAPGFITDFNGKKVKPAELAARYDVHVSPTLLFLDGHGMMLVKPRMGYNGNEFFSYYFERAITQAIEACCTAANDR